MKVGLSSYAFTWAIGVPGCLPHQPLRALGLLELAHSLGAEVLQVADNLPLHQLSPSDLTTFASRARELGISVEVGTRGVQASHLQRYVELAMRLGSPIVRVVVAEDGFHLSAEEAVSALRPQRRAFESADVKLAIENHDRLSTRDLAWIVDSLGTDWVGICLDTVNSFGALEGPAAVVDRLGPFTINLHVKDFVVRRTNHMMGFVVEGTPAGQGQLDIPWLINSLGGPGRELSAIIELWPPPEDTLEGTIAKERQWASMSVSYLKELLGARR